MLHIYYHILQWMQGNIYRDVFPTFLAKKSYDWWITRRRMEIYTKISKRKDLKWSRRNRGKFTLRMGCANLEGVVRVSHKLGAIVFRMPYLPYFSSKSYTVWSIRFLTSWDLKWYISHRKWTSRSAPKVWRKFADAVLYFLHFACFSYLLLFASLLCLACLNDPKSCQNTKTSHKYD